MAPKLHGRAFYESLGSPKHILAPMVDQSEFAWRLLSRSFLPPDLRTSLLAYSPMFHARLYAEKPKYREAHFEPTQAQRHSDEKTKEKAGAGGEAEAEGEEELYLDGNPAIDRPLIVQFCANEAEWFLEAGKHVQRYCDAVDLNLGCPQGIAKRGHYGSFLQEDWETIAKLIRTLHQELDVPVTAKMRVLETKERTLEYARMILEAGASILTVHGRQRDQKGHNTGLADWSVIRYLREQLPKETVLFANGNVLQHADLAQCLEETGADGVMSAEGNLYDPSIFGSPPLEEEDGREFWRGRNGKGGYRMDAVLRRYLDIIHTHVLNQAPPARKPLFLPSDDSAPEPTPSARTETSLPDPHPGSKHPRSESPASVATSQPQSNANPTKKQKRAAAQQAGKKKPTRSTNPNMVAMQAHCFHLLRSLVSQHHNVRDALARSRPGDIDAFENVLALTEEAVKEGLRAYEADPAAFEEGQGGEGADGVRDAECSDEAVSRCRRPYWVVQAHVRPLPKEALAKGSLQLSKKDMKRLEEEKTEKERVGIKPEGTTEIVQEEGVKEEQKGAGEAGEGKKVEVPREGMVCG